MKKVILSLLTVVALCALSAGCSTTNTNGSGTGSGTSVQDFTPAIKTAAMVGTTYALREHPEWRGKFESAAVELSVLETADKLDFSTIMAIVLRLPVKELQSDDAKLAISGATILLSGYGEKIVALDKLENLRPVARALREGIQLGSL